MAASAETSPAVCLLMGRGASTRRGLFTSRKPPPPHWDDPFHAAQYYPNTAAHPPQHAHTPPADPRVSITLCVCVCVNVAGASGGGENSRWQGCPHRVCFFGGEQCIFSELLLKEGKGISVHGQLAGSVPRTHPSLPLCVHAQTHTQTHTVCN